MESGGNELLLDTDFEASRVAAEGSVVSVAADQEKLEQVFAAVIAAFPPEVLKYTVLFRPGSALLDVRASNKIAEIVTRLRNEIPDRDFPELIVEGHTDAVGEAFDNEELARDRASTVRDALVDGGIDGSIITVNSYGERALKVRTPDGRAEARNRRVELVFR